MSHSEHFYRALPSFHSFDDLAGAQYTPVPQDWFVIITDVRGSTKAIEAGRYRDVNTIGVASITALQNILPAEDFPFVFGGDGMSALLPPHVLEQAKEELSALRLLAREQYDLELRVGLVPMMDIYAEGLDIQVAKYQMKHGTHLAMFSGGGLGLADTLIKRDQAKYEVPIMNQTTVDLARLSCRWKPIPATQDEIISILVQATPSEDRTTAEIYQKFSDELTNILGDVAAHNPVNPDQMTQRSLSNIVESLWKLQSHKWINRFVGIIFSLVALVPGFGKLIHFDGYKESLSAHSDYWKFDDMLRMILDCTFEQSQRIEALCEDWHQRGWIVYGIHHSQEALMTCQLDAFEDGKHLHFIDGGDGGYAMAAKGLKMQLNAITA